MTLLSPLGLMMMMKTNTQRVTMTKCIIKYVMLCKIYSCLYIRNLMINKPSAARCFVELLSLYKFLYNTIQYDTIRHDTTRYDTIQYNTIPYHTIQYNNLFCMHIVVNYFPVEIVKCEMGDSLGKLCQDSCLKAG